MRLLRAAIEQPFRREAFTPLLELRQERAGAGGLDRVDHDLVGRLAGIGRDLAGRDDLHALFGLELHAPERALPDHGVEAGILVLQAEIGVPRRVRAAIARDFTAHAHIAERILDGALQIG